MGCDCRKRSKDEERRRQDEVLELLEVAALRNVAEGVSAIPETSISAVRYLDRAERPEPLPLDRDLATLYRQAPERDQDQALRHSPAVIERIDERTRRDDWTDLVDPIEREFDARHESAPFEEATDRFRFARSGRA